MSRALAQPYVVLLAVLICVYAILQDVSASDLPSSATSHPIRITVQRDGSSITEVTSAVHILSVEQIERVAHYEVLYTEGIQNIIEIKAVTRKADGRTVPADIADSEVSHIKLDQSVSLLGQRVKTVEFQELSIGDTVDLSIKTESRPQVPGQFFYGKVLPFVQGAPPLRFEIVAPTDLPLQMEAHDVVTAQHSDGATTVYVIDYSSDHLMTADQARNHRTVMSKSEWAPRFYITSAGSYADLARSLDALIAPKTTVTPSVAAMAQEIAGKMDDRRAQAKAIYEWVVKHINYQAIELATNYIIPSGANTVLENGYGDCKDVAILLVALLKARNIPASLVLIQSLPETPSIPKVAYINAFDHMIVWVPELGTYLDPSVGDLPFGDLPFGEYGKPVLHFAGTDDGLHTTPILRADQSKISVSARIQIDGTGQILGEGTTSATGPAFKVLRDIARINIPKFGSERTARGMLHTIAYEKAEASIAAAPGNPTDRTFALLTNFKIKPRFSVTSGVSFSFPEGMRVVVPFSSAYLGWIGETATRGVESIPCYSGTEDDDIVLTFPADLKVKTLPSDKTVNKGPVLYNSHWSVAGNSIYLKRHTEVRFTEAYCKGQIISETQSALDVIRADYGALIAFSK